MKDYVARDEIEQAQSCARLAQLEVNMLTQRLADAERIAEQLAIALETIKGICPSNGVLPQMYQSHYKIACEALAQYAAFVKEQAK